MASQTYTCPAIHCEGCAGSISRSLGKLRGVTAVEVAVATKAVTVQYDEAVTDGAAITARLAAAGFPAEP
jgi:copper chaperone CopZ